MASMERIRYSRSQERLVDMEEILKAVLCPMESTVMRFQRLLVWESTIKSTVMIVVVHCLFWLFVYGGCSFYTTVSTIMMMLYFLQTWKKKIWPEITVPPKSPDIDKWTTVYPQLTSVPELCRHLAVIWHYLTDCCHYWIDTRRNKPLKSCVETSLICVSLAVVGHYVSGVILSYIILMSVILWPCVQYHSLLEKIYLKLEPVFMKLGYGIKVQNRWGSKYDKAGMAPPEDTDEEGHQTSSSVCADNESDLEDFYPTDPMPSMALAGDITDSDDEEVTPTQPLRPHRSMANSDRHGNYNSMADFEPSISMMPSVNMMPSCSIMPSISMMPSFDDTFDHTHNEMPDGLAFDSQAKHDSSERVMKFKPSYCDDSHKEYRVTSDYDELRSMYPQFNSQDIREKGTSSNLSEKAEPLAFTNVVRSAIQNIVFDTLQSWAGKKDQNLDQSCNDGVVSTSSDPLDDHLFLMGDSVDDGVVRERRCSEDCSNIDDEFDFLDDYDEESNEEKD